MKLPSLRDIEKITRVVPIIKDLLPVSGNSAESSLLNLIRQKDDALHDKKAEIYKLREKIQELENALENTEWMVTKKQEELDKERQ